MSKTRYTFVTNEATCMATGLPVGNCRCPGHASNQFNRAGDPDGFEDVQEVLPLPTMNLGQASPPEGEDDPDLRLHVFQGPDFLPLPRTTEVIANARRAELNAAPKQAGQAKGKAGRQAAQREGELEVLPLPRMTW